jgi:hypothetical protein
LKVSNYFVTVLGSKAAPSPRDRCSLDEEEEVDEANFPFYISHQ